MFNLNYRFVIGNNNQRFKLSYSYINDKINDNEVTFTRYSLNSLKHQLSTVFDFKFNEVFSQHIAFRYVKRTNGENYNVLDTKLLGKINAKLTMSIAVNNIFNAAYTETNLVPMPKGNGMIGLNYTIY